MQPFLESYRVNSRLGNYFFINMALHLIAQKHEIPIHYTRENEFNELGLIFYKTQGHMLVNPRPFLITDDTFMDLIRLSDISGEHIFSMGNVYFQTKEFALYLADYFLKPEHQAPIRAVNPFRERYSTNRSVYVHVRLGDKMHDNISSKAYFEKALQAIPFEDGYISSDISYHPIVQELAEEYNLITIRDTEIRTIQMASTCRYLVLSQGTFSFMIGILGFNTELVQWPQIKSPWHGDIFVIPEWKKVDW
jgi:hypothetical protein